MGRRRADAVVDFVLMNRRGTRTRDGVYIIGITRWRRWNSWWIRTCILVVFTLIFANYLLFHCILVTTSHIIVMNRILFIVFTFWCRLQCDITYRSVFIGRRRAGTIVVLSITWFDCRGIWLPRWIRMSLIKVWCNLASLNVTEALFPSVVSVNRHGIISTGHFCFHQ